MTLQTYAPADAVRNPVHFPAKSDKFEFDGEVAVIFPNMARRSIPNYDKFHELHAAMVAQRYAGRRELTILDVGASHGAFFEAFELVQKREYVLGPFPDVRMVAMDNSPTMCTIMEGKFPDADIRLMDIDSLPFMKLHETFDVVNATYVLQFIPASHQLDVLMKLKQMVKPGGMLILGQKEKHTGVVGALMHDRYIKWRIGNGYTLEEITAKTKALAGAMWPMDQNVLHRELQQSFTEVCETTRMFMFSTLVAFK